MFERCKEIYDVKKDVNTKKQLERLFETILQTSIVKITDGKVNLILRHENENTFSPNDLSRWIDQLKLEGYNVKGIFADYIDQFAPSINRYNSFNDYDIQGQITQELRSIARTYKLPVITVTQNKKESENLNADLNNSMIG